VRWTPTAQAHDRARRPPTTSLAESPPPLPSSKRAEDHTEASRGTSTCFRPKVRASRRPGHSDTCPSGVRCTPATRPRGPGRRGTDVRSLLLHGRPRRRADKFNRVRGATARAALGESSSVEGSDVSAFIITRIQVGDYDAWRPMFDQDRPRAREKATVQRVFRSADDPNHVFILLAFASLEDARTAERRLLESSVLDRFSDRHGPSVVLEVPASAS
jgi:hypothetical protein